MATLDKVLDILVIKDDLIVRGGDLCCEEMIDVLAVLSGFIGALREKEVRRSLARFHTAAHSPDIDIHQEGCDTSKRISVCLTCPTFSLGGQTWWSALKMMSRLRDWSWRAF